MTLIDRELPTALFMTTSSTFSESRHRLQAKMTDVSLFQGLFACIAEAALILSGAKYLGALLPVAAVLLWGLQVFYVRTSSQIRLIDIQAKAPLYTHLLETVDGLATIRAFKWQEATQLTALELLDNSQRPYYLLFCIQRWLTLVLDLFVAGSAILLVTFGVLTPSSTTASSIAVALYNIIGFNQSLANVIQSWTSLETSLGAIARLREFEEVTPVEVEPIEPTQPPEGWPARGEISANNMTASYSPNAEPALKDLSFSVGPGKKIAICGRTGSGKSSLLAVLFRLMELDSGTIMLDGVDVSQVFHETLRSRLISVPQEPLIFPGDIRSNLLGHPEEFSATAHATDEQIVAVLENVRLWDAVRKQEKGLDAEISEVNFSHGQKQLLGLARAILQKPNRGRILVLDEAMSSVDPETEELMSMIINQEFADFTVISVVHHLKTVRDFDVVLVLENGALVETGSPSELLAANGPFRKLWDSLQ